MFGTKMEDKYIVTTEENSSFCSYRAREYTPVSSYEEAEKLAKKRAHRYQEDYLIFKACASVEHIVPEMKVTKLVK